MGILCGYLVGTLWPNFMSASNPGPLFMMAVAVVFSFAVAYIAHRGVNRLDVGQHRDQRDSDHGAGGVCGDGARLPLQSSGREARLAVRFHLGRRLHLRVRDRRRRWSTAMRPTRSCATRTGVPQPQAGCRRQAGAVPDHLSGEGRQGQLPVAPERRFGGGRAQLRLGVHSGDGRDPDSGGIRIGDGDGRRGEERQARRSHRGDHFAAGAGAVLLPVRVLRGQLLPEQRLHHAERDGLGGAHRRHDDHGRQRMRSARAAAGSSCWWRRSRCSWR